MKTKVIFRKWPAGKGGDLIALFPTLAGTVGDPWTCESYQTIGQHGAASVRLTRDTLPAEPQEYRQLAQELSRIGYDLEIVKRFTPADERERRRQLGLST